MSIDTHHWPKRNRILSAAVFICICGSLTLRHSWGRDIDDSSQQQSVSTSQHAPTAQQHSAPTAQQHSAPSLQQHSVSFSQQRPAASSATVRSGNTNLLPYLLQAGNCPEVIRQATAIIASDPKNSDAYYYRAVAFRAQKATLDRAIEDLDHAVQLNPDLLPAYALKAVLLHEQQEDELALPAISKAFALSPTDTGIATTKATILNALNRPKEALVIEDKVLLQDPKSHNAHWVRSKTMFLLSRIDEGSKDLNLAIKLKPDDLFYRNDRLMFNGKQKKWTLIFEDADYLIAHGPHKREAYEKRAVAHVALKQYKEGIADYKSAIAQTRSDSQMRVLHAQLKTAYELAGDSKGAAAEAEYVKKLDEDIRPF
jgi:tetratricopeptide (TPR) repeat protein